MTKSWIHPVERRLSQWVGRGLGNVWVVAVSGGSDSVGLLRILTSAAERLGLRLSVAHLDHGMRGDASEADAAFVAELADSLRLPFDLGRWRPVRASHFESDARRARYEWLSDIAQARQASVVAVGHTLDDQAETILHRIIRGTGIYGLAGIPPTRTLASNPLITLVRPLLAVSRADIRDYLAEIGQPYREDQSNADVRHTRARVRHDLMPKLADDYNPRVAEALVRLGSLAGSLQRSIEADLRRLQHQSIITMSTDAIVLKHPYVSSLSAFQRTEILRRVWKSAGWPEAGMSAKRWRRLSAIVREEHSAAVDIGHHVNVSTDGSFLILRRASVPRAPNSDPRKEDQKTLETPGSLDVPWAGCRIEASLEVVDDYPAVEIIDLDQVRLPLYVRAPRPGDRFKPLGMAGASMPLADFFRGRRVPPARRSRTPVVCDQIGIIWVVGYRIADPVKRTDQTRRTLSLLKRVDEC